MPERAGPAMGDLLTASHLATLEDLPRLLAGYGASAALFDPVLYVADLQQQYLVPIPGQVDYRDMDLVPVRIDVTPAGRAFREADIVEVEPPREPPGGVAGGRRLWVPMLDGTERVGVVGLTVPVADDAHLRRAFWVASLIAILVVSKRDTSDTYAELVRMRPMGLSAEVLWNLMPAGTFANEYVVVAAALEPAYEVGGDAYDYGISGDRLHLSIFDSMGHDISAGLTATIAMAACRNARLQGAALPAISETIDEAINYHFSDVRFATGLLADLDTRTGALTWVNRGHHPPLVLRDGRHVATLETPPAEPPMGLRLGMAGGVNGYQLQPGDRLLFYTDGVIEAQSPAGELFGIDRFIDYILRHEAAGLSAPETLRRLIQTILNHQEGHLQDDATVLLVEWRTERHGELVPRALS
ncbi:serine/threonine-protein phosphatase [Spongiactinospora rosea]|uniref:Serine/threonine-protein phosphatase n=1 Tax=Spongiactinospora rosea TaxID=2248750 RepID=A0A366LPX5_9ACTN|nr:PP2C family protein-serine/threonine phosphatase [Spongiactinospora rosea]RBQ15877.1 serine/threonine-protein phosphatase [Spongiactinospora rosea]